MKLWELFVANILSAVTMFTAAWTVMMIAQWSGRRRGRQDALKKLAPCPLCEHPLGLHQAGPDFFDAEAHLRATAGLPPIPKPKPPCTKACQKCRGAPVRLDVPLDELPGYFDGARNQ